MKQFENFNDFIQFHGGQPIEDAPAPKDTETRMKLLEKRLGIKDKTNSKKKEEGDHD